MDDMKKLFCLITAFTLTATLFAQSSMTLKNPSDPFRRLDTNDALVNFPMMDENGNYCAIIKVSLTNPLRGELVLDLGSQAVVKREKREDGEIWFWVPASAKNFTFNCEGYTKIDKFPGKLEKSTDYGLEIVTEARGIEIINESVDVDYLNISVVPKQARVSVYTLDNELKSREIIIDGVYSNPFEYGKYRLEVSSSDGMYCTYTKDIVIGKDSEKKFDIVLEPDYGYLKLRTEPSGATVFIDGELIGKTPISKSDKIKSGRHTLLFQKSDYYSFETEVDVKRDSVPQSFNYSLKPQFGAVTITCSDENAEIWVDNGRKGTGTWTGYLNSQIPHQVEARRVGHQSTSIRVTVKDGETVSREIQAPVPLFATLTVTSEPAFCDVYLDGEFFKQTNFNEQVLSGTHTLTVQTKGFKTYKTEISLAHNEKRQIHVKLEKGAINVPVEITAMSGSDIYVDDVLMGSSPWSGEIHEGPRKISVRCKGYHELEMIHSVDYDDNNPTKIQKINMPALKPITGTLAITGTKGASLSINCPSGSSVHKTVPYTDSSLPLGNYSVEASKKGYFTKTAKFEIRKDETVVLDMKLKKEYWVSKKEYFSRNFFELKYGYGIQNKTNYVGFNYGFLKTHMGFNTSFMYGIETNDISGHIGPSLRLTTYPGLDFQIYAGAGARYDSKSDRMDPLFKSTKCHWSVDAGMRFNWDHEHNFSWGSAVLGCQISDKLVVPNAGISFVPELLGRSREYNFASHYLNLLTGYDIDREEIMMGGTYSWISTHLGVYASFLIGFDSGYSVTAGPVVRLTTDSIGFDLQLYGGSGVFNGSVAGDLGLRFAWRSYSEFSWWDFSVGCQYYDGTFVPTVGLAIGLSYLAGLVGLAYL